MALTQLTEKQVEKYLKAFPPIGSLAEKHPVFMYGTVHKLSDGTHEVMFMGKKGSVPSGTAVKLWDGKLITI